MATSGGGKLQKELGQSSSGSTPSFDISLHVSIESEINENRHLLFSTIHCGRHLHSYDPFLKISAAQEPTSSLVKAFAEALFDDLGISKFDVKRNDNDGLILVAETILDPVAMAYTPYDKRLTVTPLSFSCRQFLMNAAGSHVGYGEQPLSEFDSRLMAADDLMDRDDHEPEFMAPILSTVGAHGVEGVPIPLQIVASTMNIFAEDRVLFEISNVPEEAMLSVGHNEGHGVWTVAYDQINQLSLTLAKGSDKKIDLLIKAIAFGDQGKMAISVAHLRVEVRPTVVAPLVVSNNTMKEKDHSIPLTIDASLVSSMDDLSIITGVPIGATLSAGCHQGGGAWLLSATQLQGLTLTPPRDFSGNFIVKVQVISTELSGNTSIATQDISVCINADLESKTSSWNTTETDEPADISLKEKALPDVISPVLIPIQIEIELQDPTQQELICVVVSGVPSGSYFSLGVNNNDGSWTLSPLDLEGLLWTPSPGFLGNVKLTIEAIVEDIEGNSFSVTQVLPIQVMP